METNQESAETAQRFFRYFQHEITALQQQMDRLGDTALVGGERIDATEHCQAGIARLSNDVRDANVYLPAYDQRTYAQAIKALHDRLDKTKAQFAPRQKFTFKTAKKNNSALSINEPTGEGRRNHPNVPDYGSDPPSSADISGVPTPDPTQTPPSHETEFSEPATQDEKLANTQGEDEQYDEQYDPQASPGAQGTIRRPSLSASTSVTITHQKGIHIILPSSAGHATTIGTLSHLRRCIVDLSTPTVSGRPFAGLTLKNLRMSLIICGHVGGSAHLTGLSDCVVVVACRQFRMHECRRCDVYLQAAGRPIVEGVSGVRFAPLPGVYASESQHHIENQWDKVDDFKWLRQEQSPNWSKIPEEERVGDDIWRGYVPGGADRGLEDILAKVGVPKIGAWGPGRLSE